MTGLPSSAFLLSLELSRNFRRSSRLAASLCFPARDSILQIEKKTANPRDRRRQQHEADT